MFDHVTHLAAGTWGNKLKSTLYLCAIVAVWAGLYILNLGIPAFSGMEGLRYSVAKEMLVHRDWLHLYLNGDPYYNKPPLTTWLIAPMIVHFNEINEFNARLPFAMSMLVMAVLTFVVASRWIAQKRAFIVALVPITTIAALRFGRACEIDGMFAVFFIVAVIFWSDIWLSRRNRPKATILLGIAIGLGGLSKGPLILALLAVFFGLVALHGRDWRRIPILALGIGIAIPLPWVGALFASGIGHDAVNTWTHEIGMRFDPHVVPVSEPPWGMQVFWGFTLTLPWSLFYPILYYPKFLPADRVVGALLKGGRDAGLVSFLGIMIWPGLQYQYLVPVSLLMALEIAVVAVTAGRSESARLSRGLHVLTVTLTGFLIVVSGAAAFFMDSAVGLGVDAIGLLLSLMLLRRPRLVESATDEIKYALVAMAGAAAMAIFVILPPLNSFNQDRDIGQKLRAMVPPGEKLFCPFSIDNLATYIQRPVLIYVPEVQHGYLYAILRDSDLANLRRSNTLAVRDMMPFNYAAGWRHDQTTLHFVLLTMKDSAQNLRRSDVLNYIQS